MNKFLAVVLTVLVSPCCMQADGQLFQRVVHKATGAVTFVPTQPVGDVDVQVDDDDVDIDIEAGEGRPLLVKFHKQQRRRCATGRGVAKNAVIGGLCLGLVTLVGVGGYYLGKTGEGLEDKIEEIKPQLEEVLGLAQEILKTGKSILAYANWNEIKALAQAANTLLPLLKNCPHGLDLVTQAVEGTVETFCTAGS